MIALAQPTTKKGAMENTRRIQSLQNALEDLLLWKTPDDRHREAKERQKSSWDFFRKGSEKMKEVLKTNAGALKINFEGIRKRREAFSRKLKGG